MPDNTPTLSATLSLVRRHDGERTTLQQHQLQQPGTNSIDFGSSSSELPISELHETSHWCAAHHSASYPVISPVCLSPCTPTPVASVHHISIFKVMLCRGNRRLATMSGGLVQNALHLYSTYTPQKADSCLLSSLDHTLSPKTDTLQTAQVSDHRTLVKIAYTLKTTHPAVRLSRGLPSSSSPV